MVMHKSYCCNPPNKLPKIPKMIFPKDPVIAMIDPKNKIMPKTLYMVRLPSPPKCSSAQLLFPKFCKNQSALIVINIPKAIKRNPKKYVIKKDDKNTSSIHFFVKKENRLYGRFLLVYIRTSLGALLQEKKVAENQRVGPLDHLSR